MTNGNICEVEISKLKVGENSRLRVHSNLSELMEGIRQKGVLQPILVRKEDNVVICGNRRLEAVRKLGLKTIPVIYKENINNTELLLINLMENVQRRNINSIEIGRVCDLLIQQNLTDNEIAIRLGIPNTRVKICVTAYRRTPDEFKTKIAFVGSDKKSKSSNIPENVFWSIIRLNHIKKLTDREFKEILARALKESWTVEQVKIIEALYRVGTDLSLSYQMLDKFIVKTVKICFNKERLYKDMANLKALTFQSYITKILEKRDKDLLVL